LAGRSGDAAGDGETAGPGDGGSAGRQSDETGAVKRRYAHGRQRNARRILDAIHDRIEAACTRLDEHPQLGRARPEIAPDACALVIERWLALYRLTK
jgi:hypothetical protein